MKRTHWISLVTAAGLVLAVGLVWFFNTDTASAVIQDSEASGDRLEAPGDLLLAPTATPEPAEGEGSSSQGTGDLSSIRTIEVQRGMTEAGKTCIDCHKDVTPGIVNDWKDSRHGHATVSCIDCHQVQSDAPNATQHETLIGTDVFISASVGSGTCERCHPVEVEQFSQSGHVRAYLQIVPKDAMHKLINVHEGQSHPEYGNASDETGCMQCHGSEILLDEDGRPVSETWPNMGIGTVYPDGSIGNCVTCHTRHKFSIAEARHPNACASCHLGPDHPDIEIYENSKHGHIYLSDDSQNWTWDSAPDGWEPGDYRAPTCATCHMSGIGELATTHNITERLYWNLWAPESFPRDSNDPMSPKLGNAEEGRRQMEMVCSSCHSQLHTKNFFEQGDRAVNLYNEAYYKPAKEMLDDLKEKDLLKENPWKDEFQILYYHLWHHEGRRARQGALMNGPDWAHWHGFFDLMQDIYKMEDIYEQRISTGEIE